MQQVRETPRYNIASRLDRLPLPQRNRLGRVIRKELNIPRSTWCRWLKAGTPSGTKDIPAAALRVIAEKMNVTITDLVTSHKHEKDNDTDL